MLKDIISNEQGYTLEMNIFFLSLLFCHSNFLVAYSNSVFAKLKPCDQFLPLETE